MMNETIKKVEKIKESMKSKFQKKKEEMESQVWRLEEPSPVLEATIVPDNFQNHYDQNQYLTDNQNGYDYNNPNIEGDQD